MDLPAKEEDGIKGEEKGEIYLADGEDVVNVQALEQRPHREVHIDQSTAKVETTRKTRYNLQARLGAAVRRRRRRVKTHELAGTGRRMRKNLADLQSVRLHVLREARPRQREVVPHEVVDREARHQS